MTFRVLNQLPHPGKLGGVVGLSAAQVIKMIHAGSITRRIETRRYK